MSYRYASVRGLAAVVERVAPRDPGRWEEREPIRGAGGLPVKVSRSRGKQLWALVGMFDRAVGTVPSSVLSTRSTRRLFEDEAIEAFWQLAVSGRLRRWEKDVGQPLPEPSKGVVVSCLGIVADLVVPGGSVLLPVVGRAGLKDTVDTKSQAALYRGLVDLAGEGPLKRDGLGLTAADRTRLLAMVAIVLDAGTRSGELAALHVEDLADGLSAVAVRRRPQKPGLDRLDEIAAAAHVDERTARAVLSGEWERMSESLRQRVLAVVEGMPPRPEVEWYPLRDGSRVAVQRWLDVRQEVVNTLPGPRSGKHGLWVTLVPTKAGPPGVTIRPQGLQQAYARGVTALNFVMAGSYGWSPLPTTMEQLRRAVDAQPLEDAPV